MNIEELPAGVYLLKLYNGNGMEVQTEKIVKY